MAIVPIQGQVNSDIYMYKTKETPYQIGFKKLFIEMKERKFDTIRFSAYRTASKLRFIQQRLLIGFVDLSQVVDLFKDQALRDKNLIDYQLLERIIIRLLYKLPSFAEYLKSNEEKMSQNSNNSNGHNLQNFLTIMNQMSPELLNQSVQMLLGWFISLFDDKNSGSISLLKIKITLSLFSSGKPVDKFKYHFSLLSDSSNYLKHDAFEIYLQTLMNMVIGVFEGTNFQYNQESSKFMIQNKSRAIGLNEFLDKMLCEPGCQSLVWLTIFHRLVQVENVIHHVRCEVCRRETINGLRYKCTKCPNYNLCRDCFWRGIVTGNHSNSHDVKEYTAASKSHSRQFGHTLRKSFQFVRQNSLTSSNQNDALSSSQQAQQAGKMNSNFESTPKTSQAVYNSAYEFNGFSSQSLIPNYIPSNPTPSIPTIGPNQNVNCHPNHKNWLQQQQQFSQKLQMMQQNKFMNNPFSPINHSAVGYLQDNRLQMKNIQQHTQSPLSPTHGNFMPDNCMPNSNIFDQVKNNSSQCITLNEKSDNSTFTNRQTYPTNNSGYQMNQEYPMNSECQSPIAVVKFPTNKDELQDFNTRDPFMNNGEDEKIEHLLIANYAAKLEEFNRNGSLTQQGVHLTDEMKRNNPDQIIAQLEAKNLEIMHEIQKLRKEQQAANNVFKQSSSNLSSFYNDSESISNPQSFNMSDNFDGRLTSMSHRWNKSSLPPGTFSPTENQSCQSNPDPSKNLSVELKALKLRKEELNNRMFNLQENRHELLKQLQSLIQISKRPAKPSEQIIPMRMKGRDPKIGPLSRHSTGCIEDNSLEIIPSTLDPQYTNQTTPNDHYFQSGSNSLSKEAKSGYNRIAGEQTTNPSMSQSSIELKSPTISQRDVDDKSLDRRLFSPRDINAENRMNSLNRHQQHPFTQTVDSDTYLYSDPEFGSYNPRNKSNRQKTKNNHSNDMSQSTYEKKPYSDILRSNIIQGDTSTKSIEFPRSPQAMTNPITNQSNTSIHTTPYSDAYNPFYSRAYEKSSSTQI